MKKTKKRRRNSSTNKSGLVNKQNLTLQKKLSFMETAELMLFRLIIMVISPALGKKPKKEEVVAKTEDWAPLWSGVFAAQSLWMVVKALV